MKGTTRKVFKMAGGLDTSMVYAVYTNADRLLKHRHAWKVWHTLKDFGCRVYVVAPDMIIFEGSKIYSDLISLKGKVDVIIPCLRLEYLGDLVKNTAMIGAKFIWFQENNWSPELDAQCSEKDIDVIRGCVLKHKIYKKPFAIFNPCFWHGWKEKKVPNKYQK
jgi:hypothetical protein